MKQKQQDASIHLTENQLKVIRDKYLRDAPSVEAWLEGVARNIASAELLLNPKAKPSDAAKIAEHWQSRFYHLMSSWDFLPNSPTLMNAGRELQQLSACYVLPVPDSIEGVTKALSAQALIQKSGGGTGFSFSRLRPKGDSVKKTQGVASGALSFMQIFDKMTDVVKQGGVRRGANMGILHYSHPEIREFITMKSSSGVMENFNVSVGIDDKFMRAVAENKDYDLINPRTGKSVGKANAKEIFELMVESAWKSGDPGYVVIDRINESGSNPTPAMGQIESTNPCGEQPLLPWEPCNLGSINLSNFVTGPIEEGSLDWDRLGQTIAVAIRFLDNVIEVNNYPLPEIEQMAKANRRIGLGVMGWAEALVKLGLPYDSEEALKFAEKIGHFINAKALAASEDLARERGVFPAWKDSIYDPKSRNFRGKKHLPRNCARTTIAPTGTIAITAGLQGGGIEPFFAVAYTRYNAKALEARKKGEAPDPKDVFVEVNPLFKAVAEKHGYFGVSETALWKKISDNHHSVRGLAEIPPKIQKIFATAHDVSVEFHIRMQAAFQKNTDNGVSKTINLPHAATTSDVRRAYQFAYELGCKGITIYRDGSKSQQVLNISATPASKKRRRDPNEAFGAKSEYYLIKTGYGPLHIHINYDERGPYQVFTNIPPLGTEIAGLTSVLGILLSKYLAEGGDPIGILKHLNSVKGDRPFGFGDKRIDSISHAVSVALRQHLKKTGWISEEPGPKSSADALLETTRLSHCLKCFSTNVSYQSGCPQPTCHDCGYSECS